jgi:GntR family transcriptional regulator
MSNSTPPRGQYREVADRIRAGINSSEYPRGELLPIEEELAETLGVHRATVNKALKLLVAEGLVRVHRGKGTIVNAIPKILRDSAGRQRRDAREEGNARGAFAAELQRLGLTARSEVTVEEVPAPAEAAERLGLDEGATVLVRRRVMFADDTPVQLAASYLPLDIVGGTQLTQTDTGPGGTYSRLSDLGHAPIVFTEDIDIRPPADGEITALRMTEDQRVYEIVRTAETASGRVVEANVMVLPAHQWRLRFTWPASE